MAESPGAGIQPLRRQPEPFRHFLWSRFAGQVGQNALLYALLIAIVERTDSSLGSTLLVAAYIVPSILLGVPGGALADVLPKRATLTAVLLLRGVIAALLLLWGDDLLTFYLLVLAFATAGQVFAPAESASVPALLPTNRLARGNAAMSFVLIAAQVIGGVALAPVLIRFAGERVVFAVATVLFVTAAWQMLKVHGLRAVQPASPDPPGKRRPDQFIRTLAAGWRVITEDGALFRAVVRLTLIGTVIKIIVAVAPILARDVLQIAAANTVFVMAPAAIGSLIGLAIAPTLARVLGQNRLGAAGFLLFGLGTIALAFATEIGAWVTGRPELLIGQIERITHVPGVVTVAMLIAVFLGLAFSLTTVAIRALINERAPQRVQGRVFATQNTVADAVSLFPLIVAGAAADRVGVNPVLFAAGLLCILIEIGSRRAGPRVQPVSTQQAPQLGAQS
jgi:MFS family permease